MRKQFSELTTEQRALAATGLVRISAAWTRADSAKRLRLLESQVRLTGWIAGEPMRTPIRARRPSLFATEAEAKGEYVTI